MHKPEHNPEQLYDRPSAADLLQPREQERVASLAANADVEAAAEETPGGGDESQARADECRGSRGRGHKPRVDPVVSIALYGHILVSGLRLPPPLSTDASAPPASTTADHSAPSPSHAWCCPQPSSSPSSRLLSKDLTLAPPPPLDRAVHRPAKPAYSHGLGAPSTSTHSRATAGHPFSEGGSLAWASGCPERTTRSAWRTRGT